MPYFNFPSCRRVKVSIDVRLKIKMLTTGNIPSRKSETELVAYTAHGPTVAVHQCGDGGFLRPKPCNQLSGQFRKYRINLFCLTLRQMTRHTTVPREFSINESMSEISDGETRMT